MKKIISMLFALCLITACTNHYSEQWDCGVPRGQPCKSLTQLDREVEAKMIKSQEYNVCEFQHQDKIWFGEYTDTHGRVYPETVMTYCN